MAEALAFLADQFERDEAQELADHVADYVREHGGTGGELLRIRWTIEEAVLGAFGFDAEEE